MKIVWSKTAKEDFWGNIDYLEVNWNKAVVQDFINNVTHCIKILQTANTDFRKTNLPDVFGVPITKHITLFYRRKGKTIELLRFWNNYQDPDKINLR